MSTQAQLIKRFGSPIGADGKLDRTWYRNNIVFLELPFPMRLAWDKSKTVTRIRVHREVEADFRAALNEIWNHARWQCKLKFGFKESSEFYDEKSLAWLQDFGLDLLGGAMEIRNTRGSTVLSTHAYAVSIDINPEQNRMKTRGNMPAWYVRIWKRRRFIWGGDFKKRSDPMHFEHAA